VKPAPSIVFFTAASGAGYGLLFSLTLLRPFGLVPERPEFGLVALLLALALITGGLLASLTHLGHPERAWRAISQWRTSWLSREGVAAIVTYVPALLFGAALAFDWPFDAVLFGVLAAIGAAVTTWCTGMIYASLKPIRQWHQPLVAPGYMLLAAFSGAALLAALGAVWGEGRAPALVAMVFGIGAVALKLAYWRAIDTAPPIATIESATSLGAIGAVRLLDPPHTGTNYLLREMGFRIARQHSEKLRRVAVWGGFAAPAGLALLAVVLGGWPAAVVLVLGALLAIGGVLIERWLMFAEATHTVTLYYTGR